MKDALLQVILVLLVVAFGCNPSIEYSPFDSNADVKNVNIKNITLIRQTVTHPDTISIAIIADTHNYYNDFRDAVDYINSLKEIDFVIVCGDITNKGLSKEFEWYFQIISKLKVPFITVIGNHDYLANGADIYKKMFGPVNFFFDLGKCRYIFFDNVVWENNNATPDFGWLSDALYFPDSILVPVVFAHIPPFTDQLAGEKGERMVELLKDRKVTLSIFGHNHIPDERIESEMFMLVTGSVNRRVVRQIDFFAGGYSIEKHDF